VSSQYGEKDETCPVSTGGGGAPSPPTRGSRAGRTCRACEQLDFVRRGFVRRVAAAEAGAAGGGAVGGREGSEGEGVCKATTHPSSSLDETCPISTGRRTRRVQLVREGVCVCKATTHPSSSSPRSPGTGVQLGGSGWKRCGSSMQRTGTIPTPLLEPLEPFPKAVERLDERDARSSCISPGSGGARGAISLKPPHFPPP